MKTNHLVLPKSDLIKGFKQSILTVCWELKPKSSVRNKKVLRKIIFCLFDEISLFLGRSNS